MNDHTGAATLLADLEGLAVRRVEMLGIDDTRRGQGAVATHGTLYLRR
ncbi:hypothetical protein FF36_06132 [Frankia torreyi]|uniref:Uncharacterized protein n=1 Tax=Frankia torreyi TaxID=1856 RepID=A0A0D8B6M5_9ACTN|nr:MULTISPECIES: hypothetical protein [Frankia]KJE19589.1 hypothetical protein FF36_06132 [Frankia torreyi]KQM02180.1 hypothetical protein FF86_10775 [Frankia sp. CpI1-P]